MNDFDHKMETLRLRFVNRCSADKAALLQAWASRDDEALRRILHSLAGNAGMFGYPALSDAASEAEDALDRADEPGAIARALDTLLDSFPEDGPPPPGP